MPSSNPLWSAVSATVSRRGSAPAVICGERTLSFDDLARTANAISSAIDLVPGARVLIAARNSPDLLPWVAAIWRAGAIPVLLHADASARHCDHALALTDPDLVLSDDAGRWPYQTFVLHPSDVPPSNRETPAVAQRSGAEPGSIVFTSGSTGLPKGVTQSGATLIDGACRIGTMLGYRPDDRILCPVPFAFDYGWGQVLSCLIGGQTLVLPEEQNAFALCQAIDTASPTILAGVPAVFADLMGGLAPINRTRRDSIRLITSTGSKVPRPLFDTLTETFPDAAISLNYGLTETYRSASLPPSLARIQPDAVGHPVPGVEIMIVDANGRVVPRGCEGEIVHRGAGGFLGYWKDPERTARVLRPDPRGREGTAVFTGDLGRIGADGLLYIVGRRDRQMKCMGVRVAPDEIERILVEDPDVAEAAVIALDHATFGHLIVACIVPLSDQGGSGTIQGGITTLAAPTLEADATRTLLKRLKKQSRLTMSAYMQPRRWEIFDTLPRTRSGKTDYPALTALVEART